MTGLFEIECSDNFMTFDIQIAVLLFVFKFCYGLYQGSIRRKKTATDLKTKIWLTRMAGLKNQALIQ